jgi:hypothetical protein
MIRKMAIGLVAAMIATAGATMDASAFGRGFGRPHFGHFAFHRGFGHPFYGHRFYGRRFYGSRFGYGRRW